MRYLGYRFVVLLSLIDVGGCASTPPSNVVDPAEVVPDRPVIAEPCRLSAAIGAPISDTKQLRVLVELATVEGDWGAAMRQPGWGQAIGAPTPAMPSFTDLLNDWRFTIPSVGNVLLSSDVQTTIEWDLDRANDKGGCAATDRRDLSLLSHVDTDTGHDLSLELTLVPVPPLGTPKDLWEIPEHRRVHTTVVLKDQQPVVLEGFAKPRVYNGEAMLVVTPYIIRSAADLRSLFECKLRRSRGDHALYELPRAGSYSAPVGEPVNCRAQTR